MLMGAAKPHSLYDYESQDYFNRCRRRQRIGFEQAIFARG